MAISFVQQIDKQTNSNTLTVPAAGTTSGDTIMVFAITNGGGVITAISDTGGNTYVPSVGSGFVDDTVNGTVNVWHSITTHNLSSGNTISITGPSTSRVCSAYEFSGIGSVDTSTSGFSSATPTAVSTASTSTLATASDLYIMAARVTNGLTDTTTGLTNLQADFSQYYVEYKILAANTAINYLGTQGQAADYAVALVAFQPPAAGPPANLANGPKDDGSTLWTLYG